MGYSESEIKTFEEKEKRIVRQSCLKVAVWLVTERPNFRDDKELDSLALTKEMAGELYEWVYEKANEQQDSGTSSTSLGNTPGATLGQLPEPFLAQKKVLDTIVKKLNIAPTGAQPVILDDYLMLAVLDWAEKTHGSRSYPTKVSSVDEFIKWYTK